MKKCQRYTDRGATVFCFEALTIKILIQNKDFKVPRAMRTQSRTDQATT